MISYPALHPPSNTAHTHTNPTHATTTTGRHFQSSILNLVYLSICLLVGMKMNPVVDSWPCGIPLIRTRVRAMHVRTTPGPGPNNQSR